MDETCVRCGGPLTVLGTLGRLVWFRCRNCGGDQNKPWEELSEADQELVAEECA